MNSELAPWYERFFDATWYVKRYIYAAQSIENGVYRDALEHFRHYGYRHGFAPGPLFDTRTYQLASNSWHVRCDEDPIAHYARVGEAAGTSPHYLFSERFYRGLYPAVATAVERSEYRSGYHHYLDRGDAEGRRPHPLFQAFSGTLNSPQRRSFIDFVRDPDMARHAPSPLFDHSWYVKSVNFSDVLLRDFHSPLHYFLTEGLLLGHTCLPEFDSDYYELYFPEAASEVAAGRFASVFEHFLFQGIARSLDPSEYFDSSHYLKTNPEAAREIEGLALLGPFEHFMSIGRHRGYQTCPPLVEYEVSEFDTRAAFLRRARVIADYYRRYGKIRFEFAPEPDLSIVAVVHQQFDLTLNFLTSLQRSPGNFEVIIHDNASTDETVHLDQYVDGLTLLRSDTNLGYAAGCNSGWRAARAPVVVFANNDIELGPDALLHLYETLKDDSIGIVGARIVRSHGLLQEAGSIIWSTGDCHGYGRDTDPCAAHVSVARDVDYCSGCFLGVRRELLEQLDGFDETYSPGYYEETDLCVRAWQAGSRVVYRPEVLAFHLERGSFSATAPAASAALMAQHREVFRRRHAKFLARQYPAVSGIGELAADRRRRLPRAEILVIDDFPPVSQFGSGLGRTFEIYQGLAALGAPITWIATAAASAQPKDVQWQIPVGVTFHLAERLNVTLAEYILANERRFALLWIARTSSIERCQPALQQLASREDRPRLVLDTEAIAAVREWHRRRLKEPDHGADDLAQLLERELSGAAVFDHCLTVNQRDLEHLKTVPGAGKASILGHALAVPVIGADISQRQHYLFVGAIHDPHSPNMDTLMFLVRDIWPRITALQQDARLLIAGHWSDHTVTPDALIGDTPGIDWLGPVEDLSTVYEKSRVFLSPTRFAGGIPIKILEAAAHGLPVVVSQLLGQQLEWCDQNGCAVADDPDEFARLALAMYDGDGWNDRSDAIRERATTECDPQQFRAGLQSVLASLKLSFNGEPVD